MEASFGSPRPTSQEDHRLALTERFWDFLAMVLLGKNMGGETGTSKSLSFLPFLARQSIDARSLLREVLPWNLQDSNGSEAQTRVFSRSKGTPTLKLVVLGGVWDNR